MRVIVQTTGDPVTPKLIDELLARGVCMICGAGMDDFHLGHDGCRRVPIIDRLREMFEAAGMRDSALASATRNRADGNADQPACSLFGATEDARTGKIWPRAGAGENSLSQAGITENFCNWRPGGLGFLKRGYSGSEVSIDPNGGVFPCSMKTAVALGNLCGRRLNDIRGSLVAPPAFDAISVGHPEPMGPAHGLDRFFKKVPLPELAWRAAE